MKRIGILAYGILFGAVLPALLIVWSRRLDSLIALRPIDTPPIGIALVSLGVIIIVMSIVDLRRFGHGWPMSPYPPERRVSRGMYRLVSDPIYLGSVILSAGAAIVLRSGAGIWLATPLLAVACVAFVIGYERDATAQRLGPRPEPPILHLPANDDTSPDLADRLSIYFLVFLPWLIAFNAVNALGSPHDARNGWTPLDDWVPMVPWTEAIYFLVYPFVLALPMIAPTRRLLRELALQGWIAFAGVTLVYLAFPVVVEPKPVPAESVFAPLMSWERMFDEPSTAFPAFHVVWACIAAAAYARALPRLRLLWWNVAIAISISCITTGMHAIADVLSGLVASLAIVNARPIGRLVLHAAEGLANSWREWEGRFVRAMTHGLYAAAGAFFGVALAAMLSGGMTISVVSVAAATIIGAAIWAQWIEGSSKLLRPFGYYGGLIGGSAAIALTPDPWRMLAAYAVASTVVQAFGRCRCLVQGCCHGRPAADWLGIRYRHSRSRVTRLSGLAGQPLHATQLYSIVCNAFALIVMARLWSAGAPLQFIAGTAFILAGLGRFVEEHFRGEPQTPVVGGLRVYQWLAILSVVAGAVIMAAGNTPAPMPRGLGADAWATAAMVGIITFIAFGVDFPRLSARFSRLV